MEQVFINGERALPGVPLRALFYGEGLFETFRYKSRLPVFFRKHYERMERGAALLGIPLIGMAALTGLIDKALSDSRLPDAYVKVCLLSGGGSSYYDYPASGDIVIIVRDYRAREEPVKANICSFKRHSESPIRRIKSLNYLENVIARREANRTGYNESAILNEKGEITECTSSNIFWARKDTLYTPSLDCGLLAGITREILINFASEVGLAVEEGGYYPEDLAGSRFAFLTNSLSGSLLISELGGLSLPLKDELYESIKKLLRVKLGWDQN